MQGLLKRAVQLLPLITLPLTYQLPQGLFVYWVTTFGFTTSQMLVQRSAWWKRFFYKGIREESARIHRMTPQAKPSRPSSGRTLSGSETGGGRG